MASFSRRIAAGVVLAFLMIAGLALWSVKAVAADKGGRDSAGTDYCTQTGGVVELRSPAYNTNGGGQPLRLAGSANFCRYTASDGSRIHLTVNTLVATLPTLAALAYYAEEQCTTCGGGGNPASYYCSQLGGTDLFGGVNAAGGGWEGPGIDKVLDTCIFPDLSSIDSWGLYYHSAGIIRGIDLSTVLKYPNPYAPVKK